MIVHRYVENPLIKKDSIAPSRPDLHVIGIFNCGGVKLNGEIILLCRIAEAATETAIHYHVPIVNEWDNVRLLAF